jgi:hypothetical protein
MRGGSDRRKTNRGIDRRSPYFWQESPEDFMIFLSLIHDYFP